MLPRNSWNWVWSSPWISIRPNTFESTDVATWEMIRRHGNKCHNFTSLCPNDPETVIFLGYPGYKVTDSKQGLESSEPSPCVKKHGCSCLSWILSPIIRNAVKQVFIILKIPKVCQLLSLCSVEVLMHVFFPPDCHALFSSLLFPKILFQTNEYLRTPFGVGTHHTSFKNAALTPPPPPSPMLGWIDYSIKKSVFL